jgi:3-hydroxyisobutyrate dehydrogenase
MALNLVRTGIPLVVWNRSAPAAEELRAAGAEVADSVADVFARTDRVLMMLANGEVVDEVLRRASSTWTRSSRWWRRPAPRWSAAARCRQLC